MKGETQASDSREREAGSLQWLGKEDASKFCPDDRNRMVQGEDTGRQYQLCPLNLTTPPKRVTAEGTGLCLYSMPSYRWNEDLGPCWEPYLLF